MDKTPAHPPQNHPSFNCAGRVRSPKPIAVEGCQCLECEIVRAAQTPKLIQIGPLDC